MAILGFEFEEIEQLLAIVEAKQLEELIVDEEDRSLRIRGFRMVTPALPTVPSAPLRTPITETSIPIQEKRRKAISAGSHVPGSLPEGLPSDQVALTSPMMGMFYRSEKPGSPPLIEIGHEITVGQTIGLIEAMKIFSEVPAEQSGTVVAIPVKDGQLVHSGTPLIILKKRV